MGSIAAPADVYIAERAVDGHGTTMRPSDDGVTNIAVAALEKEILIVNWAHLSSNSPAIKAIAIKQFSQRK